MNMQKLNISLKKVVGKNTTVLEVQRQIQNCKGFKSKQEIKDCCIVVYHQYDEIP